MRGETLFNVLDWMPNLFDDIEIPQGMDRSLIVDSIIDKCGSLPVAFYNPIYLKQKIDFWFHKEKDVFRRLYQTELYEYNAIEDYDMHEWEDSDSTYHQDTSDTSKDVGKDTVNDDLSTKSDRSVHEDNSRNRVTDTHNTTTDDIHQTVNSDADATNEQKISAFNAAIYSPDMENTNNSSATSTTNADSTNVLTGKVTENETEDNQKTDGYTETQNRDAVTDKVLDRTASHTDDNRTHDEKLGHRHGRTGAAQGLIESQRRVVTFCTYDYIAEQFMSNFCITVW